MTRPLALIAGSLILLGLAACEPVPVDGSTPAPAALETPAPVAKPASAGTVTVPESISSIAAPHQDLSTARIRASDGCYWYTHRGPVETTELPLRTANGSPICTREQG